MKKLFLLFLFVFINAFAINTPTTKAGEYIEFFHDEIRVNMDGTVHVKEIIKINAEHQKINLGIYQDFGNFINDKKLGKKYRVSYNFIAVKRNGENENFWTETTDSGTKLLIGAKKFSPENRIPKGFNTYEIEYTMSGIILNYQDYDELYLNVTGNEWEFPINNASARVYLPPAIKIKNVYGYTGIAGEKGANYEKIKETENQVLFSTKKIRKGEGFTVALSFDKGIREIKKEEITKDFSRVNTLNKYTEMNNKTNYGYAMNIFFSVLAYYLIVWFIFGKDEDLGTITPLFSPPKGISVGLSEALILHSTNNSRVFTALIIDLCAKGYICLNEDAKSITLERTEKRVFSGDLPISDEKFLLALFMGRNKMVLYKTDYVDEPFPEIREILKRASKIYNKSVKKDEKKYIKKNSILSYGGFVIILGFFVYFIKNDIIDMILASIFMLLFSVIIAQNLLSEIRFLAKGKLSKKGIKQSLFGIIIGIVATVIFATQLGLHHADFILCLISLGTILTILVFMEIMDKPNQNGIEVIRELEGLKMYCEAVDEVFYEKITPEIYEKNLPFAIIFNCEDVWQKKFKKYFNNHILSFTKGKISFSLIDDLNKSVNKNLPIYTKNGVSASSGGGSSGGGGGSKGGGGR